LDENRLESHANIVLEVRDNERSLPCPTGRGNDPTVDNDETERYDRERGTESSNRDGNGPLHDDLDFRQETAIKVKATFMVKRSMES
jgi:hypothetical protein